MLKWFKNILDFKMKLKLLKYYCIVVFGVDKIVVVVKVFYFVYVCIIFWVLGIGCYQGLGVGFMYSSCLLVNKFVYMVK